RARDSLVTRPTAPNPSVYIIKSIASAKPKPIDAHTVILSSIMWESIASWIQTLPGACPHNLDCDCDRDCDRASNPELPQNSPKSSPAKSFTMYNDTETMVDSSDTMSYRSGTIFECSDSVSRRKTPSARIELVKLPLGNEGTIKRHFSGSSTSPESLSVRDLEVRV
ncbi:hypothetical protein JMJ78_0008162, partial [Colletotrichum scovillei]